MPINKISIIGWKEVCQILGISHSYYKQLLLAKRLPGKKIGKTWVFLREEVQDIREQRKKMRARSKK